jgi:hypothetical protein
MQRDSKKIDFKGIGRRWYCNYEAVAKRLLSDCEAAQSNRKVIAKQSGDNKEFEIALQSHKLAFR